MPSKTSNSYESTKSNFFQMQQQKKPVTEPDKDFDWRKVFFIKKRSFFPTNVIQNIQQFS